MLIFAEPEPEPELPGEIPAILKSIHYARTVVLSPLEDLYRTRTKQDRNGTLLDQWNHVLLHRDLERLISEGLVERLTNIREISPDPREKTWYKELATENLYVYVASEERSGPEFRRHTSARNGESPLVQ